MTTPAGLKIGAWGLSWIGVVALVAGKKAAASGFSGAATHSADTVTEGQGLGRGSGTWDKTVTVDILLGPRVDATLEFSPEIDVTTAGW